MTEKQQLRLWAKKLRSNLDMETISRILADKLKRRKEYQESKNIMLYYPLKDEVNLLELVEDDSKEFYLPKINGDNLLCCKFDKNTKLCESCFKTMEPDINKSSIPDIIIVPALAVDEKNYRLGYGKGFYDRFLKKINNSVKTIVCIPKQLVVKTIFPNEYDIPVDKIITD